MDVPLAQLENVLKQILDILLILLAIKLLHAHNNALNVLLLMFVLNVLQEKTLMPTTTVAVMKMRFLISKNHSQRMQPILSLVFPIWKELHVQQIMFGILQ